MKLTHEEMIQIIDDDGEGVTDWEAEFLDSLIKQGPPYTETQKQKIEQIYQQRVGDT